MRLDKNLNLSKLFPTKKYRKENVPRGSSPYNIVLLRVDFFTELRFYNMMNFTMKTNMSHTFEIIKFTLMDKT